jgi:hypothetical protein
MPNHFSTIGLTVATDQDFLALAERVAASATAIPVKGGRYLRWTSNSGAELWLQVDADGDLIGMNPHFTGKATLHVGLTQRLARPQETALDGAFHAWAAREDEPESGAYPFVFDSPDAAAHPDIDLPTKAEVQIAAFAHEIRAYDSEQAYEDAQPEGELRFASRSFIPSGLFTPQFETIDPPRAQAIFTGHVVEAEERRNPLTGQPFYWALVDTLGGRFDVVVDHGMLPARPVAGGILSGSLWLSGRLTSYGKKRCVGARS